MISYAKEELGPCILSTRALMSTGYAQLKHEGRLVYQHRLAHAEAHGLNVFDLNGLVLHKCDVRHCYNPEHLFLGTYQDNMTDKVNKGRQVKGVNTGRGVLTDQDREEIRRDFVPRGNGKRSNVYELAEKYNVHWSNIYRVIKGEFA